jgi:hypothetical protein
VKYSAVFLYLYPDKKQGTDFHLQNDGDGRGEYIKFWNTATMGEQPSDEFFASKEAEAITYFQNRRTEYQQDQVEITRLKALPRKDWQAADVKSAVQIWISRQ